jgi:hypothetical protein
VAEETPKKSWLARNWKYALLGLFFIPYFAVQNMHERKAKEAAERTAEVEADDVVTGLKVKFSKLGDTFVYQNGKELPYDGLGFAVLNWDDYQKNPDKFKKTGFEAKQEDFPIVVFFNVSGFDASGDPAVVRRAKDGTIVFELKDRPKKPVAGMTPLRDGSFKVFFRDGTSESVKEDDWYRTYMGTEPAQKLPSPEELDKLSPEELAKLGLTRMSKDEFTKKFGGEVPIPPQVPKDAKAGVRGVVIQVGGIPALQPLKQLTVYAVKGAADPVASLKDDPRIAATAKTDDNGGFSLALPPGTYTLVVEIQGKLIGNAVNQKTWPAVTVGDGWVDYEFRVSPR